MTARLYYDSPSTREFDGTIVRTDERDGCQLVWLDRTAFYPTSGGQPFDTGTLGSCRVEEVAEDEADAVVHVVAPGPHGLLRTADRVRGVVDWTRRFDHMQNHSGQHVLSAAFARVFDVRTVGFHLGIDVSTIDLAREMSAAEIHCAETEANRIVWENRPVTIRYASAEEASLLPLRTESSRSGILRLIEIAGFDLSACGGTHVAYTGAIGLIAVSAWERFKGGQRLEFLCGDRALSRLRLLRDSMAASIRSLSVVPAALPSAIERLQNDLKEQKRTISVLQSELARFRADELAHQAEAIGSYNVVLTTVDGDANALKVLAAAVVGRSGLIAVLVSTSTQAIVVARSGDVSISAQELLATLLNEFGGRGGGKPDLAQGGGLNAPAEAILEFARQIIRRAPRA